MENVDKYIEKLTEPQKSVCKKLRKLIIKANPKIVEEMKMGVPWYGGKFYIVSLKDHVNMGFCYSKGMEGLEGKGKYMRHLKFFTTKDIDEKKITGLMKLTKKKYTKNR